jgi:hypothetical protein
MRLLKSNKENFYTLIKDENNESHLARMNEMSNHTKWFRSIEEVNNRLEKAKQNDRAVLLYRGENRVMFESKTGGTDANRDPYYDILFMIGSKAKSYFRDKEKKFTELKQFDRETTIRYIFNYLNTLSKRTEFAETLEYFSDSNCFSDFRSKLYAITNNNHSLTIENFFLAFIHTLSSDPKDIKAHSVLISSSREFQVAQKFSSGGYIIAFWISNPILNQAIDYYKIEEYSKLLTKYGLPKVDAIHFPDESEVTVISAIFPHNIFYVYDLSKKRLIFNPYILETNLDNLIAHGINLNQIDFNEKIKGIYSRSIWRDDESFLNERKQ